MFVGLAVDTHHGRIPATPAKKISIHRPAVVVSGGESLQVDPFDPAEEIPVGDAVALGKHARIHAGPGRGRTRPVEPFRFVGTKRPPPCPRVGIVHRTPHHDMNPDFLGMLEELLHHRTWFISVVWPQDVHLLRLAAPGMAVGNPVDTARGEEIE